MPSIVDRLRDDKATRDLITWVVATLAAILTLVGTFVTLVHPSTGGRAAEPSTTTAAAVPTNATAAPKVSADEGSVAIGGSVTGSTITAGGGSQPAKPPK